MEDISRTLFLGPDVRLFQQVVEQAKEEKGACRMCHSGETQTDAVASKKQRTSPEQSPPCQQDLEYQITKWPKFKALNYGRPIKTSLTSHRPMKKDLVQLPGTLLRHLAPLCLL